MKIVIKDYIEGKKIKCDLGAVFGNVVKSKIFYKDFIAGIRNMLGLEVKEYTKMMEEAREIAIERMKENAKRLGANAIINVRLMTVPTSIGTGEVIAYGDAVIVGDVDD